MSGAGRCTAATCLEDLGWFVVDNLPPALMLAPWPSSAPARRAASTSGSPSCVDVRGRRFFADLRERRRRRCDERGVTPRVLFLDATDEVLVRRFESVRRPHPLQGDGPDRSTASPPSASCCATCAASADLVIDTSSLNVHQLRAQGRRRCSAATTARRCGSTVMSFGFKYGLPLDADFVADCASCPTRTGCPSCAP